MITLTIISFILSAVLLVVSLSLKTVLLAMRVALKAAEKSLKVSTKVAKNFSQDIGLADSSVGEAVQGISNAAQKTKQTAQKGVNAVKKTGQATVKAVKTTGKVAKTTAKTTAKATKTTVKAAKTTVKVGKKAVQLSIKAIKLAIKAIQAIINLIHALVTLLLSLGVVGIVILVVIILFLVAAIAGAVLTTIIIPNSTDVNEVSGGDSSVIVVRPGDTQALCDVCEKLGRWYIANVDTYSAPATEWYTCDILPTENKQVGDSCAYFASAYVTMVSGKYVCYANAGQWYMTTEEAAEWSASHSGTLNSAQSALEDCGFVRYTMTQIGGVSGLLPGDILVSSGTDPLQEGDYGHCEVYLGTDTTFGWGVVKSSYPTTVPLADQEKTDSSGNVHKYVSDWVNRETGNNYHWYGVVWRYAGGAVNNEDS